MNKETIREKAEKLAKENEYYKIGVLFDGGEGMIKAYEEELKKEKVQKRA